MSVKNVLFVMMDQLSWDALACYGNSIVDTPNIDALAANGMRFTNAYTQGTSCGNSRASFYTGRYVRSHGGTWNDFPYRVDELNVADHIEPTGAKVVLMGKTHMKPATLDYDRLGIDPQSDLGKHLYNAGFTEGEHDDGLHSEGPAGKYSKREPRYNDWLREHGFNGDNPWFQWANAAEDESGTVRSGFFMEYAHLPARVPKEFSESSYLTDRAIDVLDAMGDESFFLHLSYIKPHWPYIASAPYHALYQDADFPAANRLDSEKEDPHPVYQAFMNTPVARCFADDAKRRHVLPTYYGLVNQLDEEIGRIVAHLKKLDLLKETMIVVTSDHGDFMGDHWLGEKDLFFDSIAKLPLIVVDPSAQADETRGTTCDSLVGSIDLMPTFIESLGGEPAWHRLEGESLVGVLHGESVSTDREIIVAESDYCRFPFAKSLGRSSYDARMTMAFDGRYKLFHHAGMPSMLYDLHEDPDELYDRGIDPAYAAVRERLLVQLLDWSAGLKNRPVSEEQFESSYGRSLRRGILIGVWNGDEVPDDRRIPEHLQLF